LREVEDNNKAELIYYERENTAGPKKGDVFILKVQEAEVFKKPTRETSQNQRHYRKG